MPTHHHQRHPHNTCNDTQLLQLGMAARHPPNNSSSAQLLNLTWSSSYQS